MPLGIFGSHAKFRVLESSLVYLSTSLSAVVNMNDVRLIVMLYVRLVLYKNIIIVYK